jgi:hypothetical protein
MLDLVERCHANNADKEQLREDTATLLADLTTAGVVHKGDDGTLALTDGLQLDFSLYHSLSLFLVNALEGLDPEHADYALDVVSLTEAILENPRAVLMRQADKARDALHWEMKAEGVPYEERIERLKDVSWPKPQAEWINALFEAYAVQHPWVEGEEVHPKSIVRDMLEQLAGFSSYVREYGLERSEGVLLRAITQTYKTLLQNVPAERQNDRLIEVISTLRALLGRVDSSLVAEWERMGSSEGDQEAAVAPIDISQDTKRFHARIRAELHALVRALSGSDWDEVVGCVRHVEMEHQAPWTPERVAAAMAEFVEEFGPVCFDHRARLAEHTRIRKTGALQWSVQQRLLDPEETGAWSIDCAIDLRGDTNPPGSLLQLLDISE